MNSQLPLFGEPAKPPTLPYQPHSETSKAAAVAMQDSAETLKGMVLALFKRAGRVGMTDGELISMMPARCCESSVRPRRIGLVDDGVVVDSGQKRHSPSGRQATVWVLAEYKQEVEE